MVTGHYDPNVTRLRGPPRTDLRALRLRVGWTQRDAGDAVHRREHMWSKYETGGLVIPPEVEELFRYKIALEMDPGLERVVDEVLKGATIERFVMAQPHDDEAAADEEDEPAPPPKRRASG